MGEVGNLASKYVGNLASKYVGNLASNMLETSPANMYTLNRGNSTSSANMFLSDRFQASLAESCEFRGILKFKSRSLPNK